MTVDDVLADYITRSRKAEGLTQEDAAQLMGRTGKWLSDRERGAVRVTAADLVAMSRAWGLNYGEALALAKERTESRVEATG